MTSIAAIRGRIPVLDVATALALFAMSLLFARPLLEEWGLGAYFAQHGVHSYLDLARAFPLRPLQAVPTAWQWRLGMGSALGYAVGYGALLVAKYVALRWAIARSVPARGAWLIASLGAVLLPWSASWRLRYSAAELSTFFLFLALGAVLRGRDGRRVAWVAAAAVAVALMLATYQALAVCAAVLPAVALLGQRQRPVQAGRALRTWSARIAVAWAPIALGGLLYGAYDLIAVEIAGSVGYEAIIMNGTNQLTPSGAIDAIPRLYGTEYWRVPWTLPLLAALILPLVWGPISALPTRAERLRWSAGLAGGLLLLPVLSLPYIANSLFVGDPDRIGFPPAVGYVLLVTTALMRFGDPRRSPQRPEIRRRVQLAIPAIVAVLLVWTVPLGNEARRDYELQDTVLAATASAAAAKGATSVILRDHTGKLGDVYTLYSTSLQSALTVRGSLVTVAVLCTPTGVDRITPDANALNVATTPGCESVPPAAPNTIVLQVTEPPGGGLAVKRAPDSPL